jgi:hypothetical protein
MLNNKIPTSRIVEIVTEAVGGAGGVGGRARASGGPACLGVGDDSACRPRSLRSRRHA